MKTNLILKNILLVTALICASILLFILYFIVREAAPLIDRFSFHRFFKGTGWHPLEGDYSLTPMLAGSLLAALGAVLISTPIGVAVAVFGQFYTSKKIQILYRYIVELLASVPSVVYGLWGLTCLVPMVALWAPPGASLLSGIIILAMIITPLFIITTDAALSAVPSAFTQGAEALGISRLSIILKIVIPISLPGMISGIILQTGRALGETMAVLMVMGNIVQIPTSIFEPARTLTANIALEMAYANGEHRTALFVSGLVLLLATIIIVLAAYQFKKKPYELR